MRNTYNFSQDVRVRAIEKLAFSITPMINGFINGAVGSAAGSLGNASYYLGSLLPESIGKGVKDLGDTMSRYNQDYVAKHLQDRAKYEKSDFPLYVAGNMLGNKLIAMSPLGFF